MLQSAGFEGLVGLPRFPFYPAVDILSDGCHHEYNGHDARRSSLGCEQGPHRAHSVRPLIARFRQACVVLFVYEIRPFD